MTLWVILSAWTCLNPCFNGICSRSRQTRRRLRGGMAVLILVLMEYALEAGPVKLQIESVILVLILVLMEYALEARCRE